MTTGETNIITQVSIQLINIVMYGLIVEDHTMIHLVLLQETQVQAVQVQMLVKLIQFARNNQMENGTN